MTHKYDTTLQQVEELEVAGLESRQMLGTHGSIQVSWTNARELGQVIHHLEKYERKGLMR